MGKEAGHNSRCGKFGTGIARAGYSARAGAFAHYGLGRSSMANYGGVVDLFKAWREMRRDGAKYNVGTRRKPYEGLAPLEKSAYDTMTEMAFADYRNRRELYFANFARGTESGYGKAAKGDSYGSNIVNLADYRASMLDSAYRRTNNSLMRIPATYCRLHLY